MDFLRCSCRAWWCCGMCAAFVHPVEDHDPQISSSNSPSSQSEGLLAGPAVAVSFPTALRAPEDIHFDDERGHGTCQKVEPSQLSIEITQQRSNENGSQPGAAIDNDKSCQESDEAMRISEKLGEIENSLKESGLAKIADDEDICPTCLDGYDCENPKIITACGHHFHLGCILEWAERRPTCPVCDKEMHFNETF